MHTHTFMTAAASALALACTGVALASHHAGPHAHGGPAMERADTNGDGIITLEEAKAKGAERFARMDANADGAISRADREARAEERAGEHFAQADADSDGEVTPEEMTAAHAKREAERAERRAEHQARMFAMLDTDNSGGLSQAEMEAGRAKRAERGGHPGPRMGRPHMAGPEMAGPEAGGPRGGMGPMHMLRLADTNKDQTISRKEFDAMIEAHFARIDTDGSGTITAEEREAAKAAMRSRFAMPGAREGIGAGS